MRSVLQIQSMYGRKGKDDTALGEGDGGRLWKSGASDVAETSLRQFGRWRCGVFVRRRRLLPWSCLWSLFGRASGVGEESVSSLQDSAAVLERTIKLPVREERILENLNVVRVSTHYRATPRNTTPVVNSAY
jgi:hypothetical protein